MNLHTIGLNHKSAPVEIREKLAFTESSIPIALSSFTQSFPSSEAVILSTCNRVEVYGSSPEDCLNKETMIDFFSAFHGLPKEKFSDHIYHYNNMDAVKHLFFVTSSLDSMVVGESQILSQVKEAYMTASSLEATGNVLNQLFQRALNVAKDIHTSTKISQGKVSISSVAVDFAEKIFKDFSDKTVFIIGAGEMCELVLKHLVNKGTKTVMVANRSYDRAKILADEYQGEALNYELLESYLPKADIIISSTAASHYVIHTDQIKKAIKIRRGNPMLLVDIAVPRDINPEIAKIDNVYMYNIDDLQVVVNKNMDHREKEFKQCQGIIDKEVSKFMAWVEELKIGPAIGQLRTHFHSIGKEELERLKPKLKDVAHDEWEQIVYTMERAINKILHRPAKVGKEHAKNGGGYQYVETLKNLFGIKHQVTPPKDNIKKD